MHVVYVATGDFPSRYARAVQILKNAQAWAKISDRFGFFSNLSYLNWLKRKTIDLHDYYSIETPFSVNFYPYFIFERYKVPVLKELYYNCVAKRCKKDGVDLVYTRTYTMAKSAVQQGVNVIVETHGPPDNNPDKLELYRQLQYPEFLAMVTISDNLKQRYIDFGLPEEKILVAPDGVDLERFSSPLSKVEARQKLGLEKESTIAAYVGHLYEDRGMLEMIEAARLCPEITFVMVGGHDEDIQKWKAQTKDITNLKFMGFVKNIEVPKWLWAADMLLMPYNTRCRTADWMSPLKLFEYMAAGRPIVGTKLPALETILRHKDNSVLVEPDSGKRLAEGIQLLAHDEELSQQISQAALSEVEQYSWDQRVQSIRSFIDM